MMCTFRCINRYHCNVFLIGLRMAKNAGKTYPIKQLIQCVQLFSPVLQQLRQQNCELNGRRCLLSHINTHEHIYTHARMHSNVVAHAHIANVTQPKRSPVFFILKRMQKHLIQHIWLIIQRQRMIFVYSPYPIGTE